MNTVTHGRLRASYTAHADRRFVGLRVPLPNYRQQDTHSCGFVAALTVARYFDPEVSDVDVLRHVRPSVNWGVSRHGMVTGLIRLGMTVYYCTDLSVAWLRHFVRDGVPVIVSVWPEGWISDHWSVVHGFGDGRVYLSNHTTLSVAQFTEEWSDMDMRGQGGSREGIMCAR